MSRTILVVAAHPDDEVLGVEELLRGMLLHEVHVVLADGVKSRRDVTSVKFNVVIIRVMRRLKFWV